MVYTGVSFKQHKDHAFVLERESHILKQCEVRVKRGAHVLPAPKCEICILPILERDTRISNSIWETCVLSQTQPMLNIRVSTPREVCVSTKQRETVFKIACLQDIKSQKALAFRDWRLVPQMSP